MKIQILTLCILVVLSACNENDRHATVQSKDTVTIDIPKDRDGKSVLFERTLQTRDYFGHLDTLENGYDSLQIRLWYEYQIGKPQRQIVIIKRRDNVWSGELQNIEWYRDDDTSYVTKRDIQQGVPKMGWNTFIDSLSKLEILTLPDERNIPNLNITYNTSIIITEVATKTSYRYYSYSLPKEYVDSFPQAKKMEQIMDLIEEQLGFKRIQKI